jgi:hypothetical protein
MNPHVTCSIRSDIISEGPWEWQEELFHFCYFLSDESIAKMLYLSDRLAV